jgi:hypothetical protein
MMCCDDEVFGRWETGLGHDALYSRELRQKRAEDRRWQHRRADGLVGDAVEAIFGRHGSTSLDKHGVGHPSPRGKLDHEVLARATSRVLVACQGEAAY